MSRQWGHGFHTGEQNMCDFLERWNASRRVRFSHVWHWRLRRYWWRYVFLFPIKWSVTLTYAHVTILGSSWELV